MKQKFKSAEQKRQFLENEKSWNELCKKHGVSNGKAKKSDDRLVYSLSNPSGRGKLDIPSRVTSGGSTSAKSVNKYTGTLITGIGVMHKSNLVPIIDSNQAKEIASMRR